MGSFVGRLREESGQGTHDSRAVCGGLCRHRQGGSDAQLHPPDCDVHLPARGHRARRVNRARVSRLAGRPAFRHAPVQLGAWRRGRGPDPCCGQHTGRSVRGVPGEPVRRRPSCIAEAAPCASFCGFERAAGRVLQLDDLHAHAGPARTRSSRKPRCDLDELEHRVRSPARS